MLVEVVKLLHHVIEFIGGALIVFGAVTLGLNLKDGLGGGSQLAGSIAMITGGGMIIAFGRIFS